MYIYIYIISPTLLSRFLDSLDFCSQGVKTNICGLAEASGGRPGEGRGRSNGSGLVPSSGELLRTTILVDNYHGYLLGYVDNYHG